MKKILMGVSAAVISMVITGCMTAREKIQEEYARLTALPPAERVHAPDRSIDDLGRLSHDSFNEMHGVMKAYVAASENHREYVGFMNDVQCCVQEEKLSNEDACKKVADAVIAEDANRPADEKVWPKVVEGINAVNALDPAKKLEELGVLTIRNAGFIKTAAELRNSFNGFDAATLQKVEAVGKIGVQLKDTSECLAFLVEQFRRVQVLKYYKK